MYDCVYACMKERDRGQMVRSYFSELKSVKNKQKKKTDNVMAEKYLLSTFP